MDMVGGRQSTIFCQAATSHLLCVSWFVVFHFSGTGKWCLFDDMTRSTAGSVNVPKPFSSLSSTGVLGQSSGVAGHHVSNSLSPGASAVVSGFIISF